MGKKLKEALKEGAVPYKKTRKLTSGMVIREMRILQGMTQNELAKATGLPQAAISALECDRVSIGVERAKVLARALKVHPSVLAFPDWDMEQSA